MTLKIKAASGAPINQVIQPGQAHFAMVEKTALYNLDELMRQDMQAARLIVSLVRLMEPGSGGVVVVSRASLAELLGVSLPTVQRAIRTLVEGHWVHRLKIGGAYALAVNTAVAWVGPRGQLAHAVFSATVIASRSEQDAVGLDPGTLRQIPTALPGEAVLPYGAEPEPPAQQSLDGVPHAIATQGGAA
ncbi:helix-turn-helix domain-containing protein [Acidovorax sp. FJL06]|uniref:helix-turn-helix domain-containing protein n=1 Tax=Acidovorax sp. FJL06 TaxID=2153365 RepID=UPI00131539B9|nr:GntR family transcriptional regulator [Acidovorax sp. FJL06]